MRKSIYVLEDESDLRELFTYLLRQEGFQVSAYPSAALFHEALKLQTLPDLIVLDVRLPDGNGIDICNQLKASEKTKDIPILIMSAHKDLLAMKVNSRADDHLEKPFDIDTFTQRVNKLLA